MLKSQHSIACNNDTRPQTPATERFRNRLRRTKGSPIPQNSRSPLALNGAMSSRTEFPAFDQNADATASISQRPLFDPRQTIFGRGLVLAQGNHQALGRRPPYWEAVAFAGSAII